MFVAPTLGNAAILAGDGVKMAGNFSMPFCMNTEKKIKKKIGICSYACFHVHVSEVVSQFAHKTYFIGSIYNRKLITMMVCIYCMVIFINMKECKSEAIT